MAEEKVAPPLPKVDAIVVAGGSPPAGDELLAHTGVEKKALLKIGGRAMICYVVEALAAAPHVEHIVIVGLGPADGLEFSRTVEYVPARGDILDNCVAGLERLRQVNPAADYVILSSADIPLLTPEAIEHFIAACLAVEADVYYPIVKKSVMEEHFPGAGRTYATVRDGHFAGGDLFMVRASVMQLNLHLTRRLIEARKSIWRLVKLIGPKMIFKFLTRRLTIAEAEEIVGQALNCRAKAIISPYAELGMDVDKVHQLEMARSLLEAQKGR